MPKILWDELADIDPWEVFAAWLHAVSVAEAANVLEIDPDALLTYIAYFQQEGVMLPNKPLGLPLDYMPPGL